MSTPRFNNYLAVVTGASRGIGRAIAIALAKQGAKVLAIGRDRAELRATANLAGQSSEVTGFPTDLTIDAEIGRLRTYLESLGRNLDILIHSAGIIHHQTMESGLIASLDAQYATNVRAPYELTHELLPLLMQAQGQVVFVNSSAGLSAVRAELGQYSATKHALKAIADSFREEVNPKGMRVLSLYLGRTATPMQESLYRQEKKTYHPERLLQPEDVASVIVHALALPRTAEITDISIRPSDKTY